MKDAFYILIILIIMFFFYSNNNKINTEYITKVDTIYKLKIDTINIKSKAKVIYKHDTIYTTRAFDAQLDTTIKNNIIKINYSFPENTFRFNLIKSDTLITLNKIELIESDKTKECFYYGYLSGAISTVLLVILIK